MQDINVNLAASFPRETKWLKALLAITTVLLIVGLLAPIITLKKFVLIENTFSVLSGVIQLLSEGQFLLFILIGGFSVILPFLKILMLFRLLGKRTDQQHLSKYLHWMHLYGKWSMLDVFVVAVLVVAVKLGAIASVEIQFGLYTFAAAILLTMYITAKVVSLSDLLTEKKQDDYSSP
ncbi:paraquat-inducible protein A [Thiomicrorhabdus sp.]|uniref:paraquat-inducible protein A n=1 Tax=Thiomicrorhabdus sp. TaxID=2039724 RepID=UPI0029C9194F|nr:paraquat-inducible protein A [Thiomicrorhabdus sp.]